MSVWGLDLRDRQKTTGHGRGRHKFGAVPTAVIIASCGRQDGAILMRATLGLTQLYSVRLAQLYSVTALCTPRSLSTSAAVAAANARAVPVLAERRRVSSSAKLVFGAATTATLSSTAAAAAAAAVAEANGRAAAHLQKRRGRVLMSGEDPDGVQVGRIQIARHVRLLKAVLSRLPPGAEVTREQLQSLMGFLSDDMYGCTLKQLRLKEPPGAFDAAVLMLMGGADADAASAASALGGRASAALVRRQSLRVPLAAAEWATAAPPPTPSTRCLGEVAGATTWLTNEPQRVDELLASSGLLEAPAIGFDLEWTPTMVRPHPSPPFPP